MDPIKLELTSNQRTTILNALLYYESYCHNHHVHNWKVPEIKEAIDVISHSKCGDPYCSYCGGTGKRLEQVDD